MLNLPVKHDGVYFLNHFTFNMNILDVNQNPLKLFRIPLSYSNYDLLMGKMAKKVE